MDLEECSGTCSSKHTYQLRLSPTKIEGVKNQATKYEINIRFLEPSGFEGIVAEAHAWKKFINDQVGPSS